MSAIDFFINISNLEIDFSFSTHVHNGAQIISETILARKNYSFVDWLVY